MNQRHLARLFALVVLGMVVFQWVVTAQAPRTQAPKAQAPAAQKRPLTYDAVDYWQTIQGTRLSNDGQWLAYATTSQAEDGELVVRNLKPARSSVTSRNRADLHPGRGFLVFTIAQSKADEEKERQSTAPGPRLAPDRVRAAKVPRLRRPESRARASASWRCPPAR